MQPTKANPDFASWAFWLFAASVVLLPIGLGGDRAFPLGLAQIGLALSCALVSLSPVWQQVRFFPRLRVALGLIAIVLVWAFIQTQPIVPASWTHPFWHEASGALGPLHGAISVSPEDSLKGIARLITYIAAGLLAYVLGQDVRRAERLLQILWYTGATICLYGLVEYIGGFNHVLWFEKTSYFDDLTATFINRNHFAVYAGMILACGGALLFRSWNKNVASAKPHNRIAAMREWVGKQGMAQFFALALVLACVVLTHSRAGLTAVLIGLCGYILFYQIYRRAWRRAWIMGCLMVVILAVVASFAASVSDHVAMLFTDSSSTYRARVDALGWHALMDNPWLGYGLNGFEPEFRLYRQDIFPEFNHAHNDILESLIDLGIPVGLMLWSAIALMLGGLWHGIRRRRRDGIYPALALATSFMVLAHAFVDFDLQIPGVAVTWAALVGTGLAQSWGQSERP